jgi:activator of HSP90 ATPase
MQSGVPPDAKPAEISRELGGAFSLFAGHIVGRQIELVPSERLVQAWRVVDWKPGVFSIAEFQLTEQGGDTKLVFDHTGFPKGTAQHLADGWKGNYWEPMAKVLA